MTWLMVALPHPPPSAGNFFAMPVTGILNPSSSDPWTVTGTRLFDPPHKVDQSLKRHPKKPEIILQPQPSDDPNDPLNWSPLVKEVSVVALS